MRARPPLERASPYRERARRRGGAARSQSAGRDEKLVPDIYLTIPGCSDAPRPEVSTADSEEYDPYLTRDNRGTHLLYLPSFKPSLPKTKQKKTPTTFTLAKLRAAPWFGEKFANAVFLLLGVAVENLRLSTGSLFALGLKVQRGHCRLQYRQTRRVGQPKYGPNTLRQALFIHWYVYVC